MSDHHVPRATYRLQLHGGFTLDDARDLVGYLADLGIEDLYLSPILTVAPGATHGYHTTDPTTVNTELGGDAALARLRSAMDERSVGIVLDIVPNHLAATVDDPWWEDVLTHGRGSQHAAAFDIDWEAGDGRLVLPILGEALEEALRSGALRLDRDDRGPHLRYHDQRLPLDPATVSGVEIPTSDPDTVGQVIEAQHYRPAYWREGVRELNYRRFFDITELVGVRVEDPAVFEATHERIIELVGAGTVRGLRVDHVDGLRDPTGYLQLLRDRTADASAGERPYLIVEDILEGVEPLPEEWPVDGTTGYEFLVGVHGWLVDHDGVERLRTIYDERTGRTDPAPALVRDRKRAVLDDLFAGEVASLTRRFADLAGRVTDPPALDRERLRAAVVAVTVALPVYRTYSREDEPLREQDREVLERTLAEVRQREPAVDGTELAFVARVLTLALPAGLAPEVQHAWYDTVLRWQQLTGPAMAKGFEDTTFYVRFPLAALNEVGVDAHGIDEPPTVDEVHDRVGQRARAWPHTMNATSTHDTKRSEDLRARLLVLADVPDEWADAVARWSQRTEDLRAEVGGTRAPDDNERWLLFQTLVGMWPFGGTADVRDRLHGFMTKALREAKEHSSWLEPDEGYETAVAAFVDGVLDDEELVADLAGFVERIALPGAVNSLAQVVAKLAAPGVPDLYQGTGLWDLSLVDPDNRRPVDYALRRRFLDEIAEGWQRDPAGTVAAARDSWQDGRLKLLVTWRALQARRDDPALFLDGTYEPLRAGGPRERDVIGFVRRHDARWAAALFARGGAAVADPSTWPLGELWTGTTVELPHGDAVDVLSGQGATGGETDLVDVFAHLPVALLTGVP